MRMILFSNVVSNSSWLMISLVMTATHTTLTTVRAYKLWHMFGDHDVMIFPIQLQ